MFKEWQGCIMLAILCCPVRAASASGDIACPVAKESIAPGLANILVESDYASAVQVHSSVKGRVKYEKWNQERTQEMVDDLEVMPIGSGLKTDLMKEAHYGGALAKSFEGIQVEWTLPDSLVANTYENIIHFDHLSPQDKRNVQKRFKGFPDKLKTPDYVMNFDDPESSAVGDCFSSSSFWESLDLKRRKGCEFSVEEAARDWNKEANLKKRKEIYQNHVNKKCVKYMDVDDATKYPHPVIVSNAASLVGELRTEANAGLPAMNKALVWMKKDREFLDWSTKIQESCELLLVLDFREPCGEDKIRGVIRVPTVVDFPDKEENEEQEEMEAKEKQA